MAHSFAIMRKTEPGAGLRRSTAAARRAQKGADAAVEAMERFGVCGHAVEEIRAAYEKYAQEVQALVQPTKKNGIGSLFFKNRTLQDSKVNQTLIDEVRGQIDEMLLALDGGGAEEVAGAVAAVRFMLLEVCQSYDHASKDSWFKMRWEDSGIYWMFCAMQTLCMPLLEYLPRAELEKIVEEYTALVPRQRELPNQKKLKKAMREQLQAAET